MRRLSLSLLFLVFAVAPAFCQSRWDDLKQLRPGHKIVVVQTSMARVEGRFVSASDDALTIEADHQQTTIPREKIARVSGTSHRVRNVILCALAGVAVGAAVGHTQDTPQATRDGVGAIVGGVAGAAGGAAIPTGKTYYRVEKPSDQHVTR